MGDIPGGLGLTLIREFVELNGGVLAVAFDKGFWRQDGSDVTMDGMRMPYPGTSIDLEIDSADTKQYNVKLQTDPNNIW